MCLRRCAASCLSFFSTIYPAFLCRTSRFDALGIKDRIAWLRFAPGFLPGCFDQMLQDLLPQPAQTCAPAEAVYGRAGRKIVRQIPPLAPCFHEVQPRVCQFPLAPLVRSHPGIEWFYHCPLCICQVARVRLPHFIASFHVFILLLESAFVNAGSKCRDCMMKKNIEQDVRILCPKCAVIYEDSGYKLKQVNPEQSYERYMICNKPKGKDYIVSEVQ